MKFPKTIILLSCLAVLIVAGCGGGGGGNSPANNPGNQSQPGETVINGKA